MHELTPDERYVWFGFLLLAGDCAHEGNICATENSGYTDDQLADLLKTEKDLIQRAKRKFIKYGKITITPSGIINISKWKLYQSEYDRQKSYRVKLQDEVTNCSISISSSLSSLDSKIKEIQILWCNFADLHGLPKINGIDPGSKRHRAITARLKDKSFDFSKLLDAVAASPFLLGKKTDFKATFDWVIAPSNYTKILEGNYRGTTPLDGPREWLKQQEVKDGNG